MIERCVDACIAVKWVIQEPHHPEAVALLNDSAASGTVLIAPTLFHAEVDSVIRKYAYQGVLTAEQEVAALARLDAAPIQALDTAGVRSRAREIARQLHQRQVYDSLYAALAEQRACEFWTAGEEFYRKARRLLPYVRFLAEYPITPPA